jgi:hypothetical protein
MASYKQVAQLLKSGKSPSEIIQALDIYPSRLEQILAGPRLKRLLQTDLLVSGALARTVQLAAAGDAVNQLAKLAMSDNEKVSLQATLTILGGLGRREKSFSPVRDCPPSPRFDESPPPRFDPPPVFVAQNRTTTLQTQ